MAIRKVTELTAILANALASTDEFIVTDVSDTTDAPDYMRSAGTVFRAGTPDGTNVVLASDTGTRTCDILVG